MQKRLALSMILLSPLALSGCGFAVMHTARKIYKDGTHQQQAEAVEQALARYREALLQGDAAKAASLYTEGGEFSQGTAAPVLGRPAIQAFLQQPEGSRPTEYELKADSTHVDGEYARQKGSYRQKTVTLQGQAVEVSGTFDARWARQGGDWLIDRMHTESP